MRTAWGYDVSSSIEPIISEFDFHNMTGNGYRSNPQVHAALIAASQAIRNYCGWHITPSLSCTAKPVGGAAVLRLPAGYVSAVESVKEQGATLDSGAYELRSDGLIRKKDGAYWAEAWDGIEVVYTAGYSEAAVPDLVSAVVSIATGVMSVSPGVTNESADGVSVSYSANAASIAAALTSQQKSALEHYKVVNSHAA